jgi:hypothetical protein
MTYDRTRVKAKFFDRERNRSLGGGAVLVFLKNSVEIGRVESAWSAEFEKEVALKALVVARNDEEFNALAGETSQFAILDSTRPSLNNQILILDDSAGTTAGDGYYWRFVVKKKGMRWVP